jgi:P-type conjugative transfer protein TrbJ
MSWTKIRNLSLTLAGLALLLFGPVRAAFATGYPVIDVANLQQAIIQVAKAVVQINNQIRQIQLMRSQIRSMTTNLEGYLDPSWRDLSVYVLELNELVNRGESLGYSTEEVFEVFRQVVGSQVISLPRGGFEPD